MRALMFVSTGLAATLLVWFVSGPPDRVWLYWPGVALVAVAVAAMFAPQLAAWWRRHRSAVR